MNYILALLVGTLLLGVVLFSAKDSAMPEDTVVKSQPDTLQESNEPTVVEEKTTVEAGAGNLSGQGLIKVPEKIFSQSNLKVLDVSNNALSGSLQAEVRLLQNLRVLNLSNNNFTGVPAEVGQLSKLEVLNLANNPITGLPYEIGNLQNLQTLDLRGTKYAPQDLEVIRRTLPASTKVLVD